jgi:hypothetical protein
MNTVIAAYRSDEKIPQSRRNVVRLLITQASRDADANDTPGARPLDAEPDRVIDRKVFARGAN